MQRARHRGCHSRLARRWEIGVVKSNEASVHLEVTGTAVNESDGGTAQTSDGLLEMKMAMLPPDVSFWEA